ncbi:hypothetical protein ACLBYE_29050, partial [Methylobacterium sp. A52T]
MPEAFPDFERIRRAVSRRDAQLNLLGNLCSVQLSYGDDRRSIAFSPAEANRGRWSGAVPGPCDLGGSMRGGAAVMLAASLAAALAVAAPCPAGAAPRAGPSACATG